MEKYEKVINTLKDRPRGSGQLLNMANNGGVLGRATSAVSKKILGTKLQFHAEQTRVLCGENCSFVGRNFFEILVLFFPFTAFFF